MMLINRMDGYNITRFVIKYFLDYKREHIISIPTFAHTDI